MAKKIEIPQYVLDGAIRHFEAVLSNHKPRQRTIRAMEAYRQAKLDLAKLRRIRAKQG